jgi:DNA-binding NtrC family response regulator
MQKADVKGRVLVVDDEEQIRELLREHLSLEGYECRTCPRGDEALTAMTQEGFDVVVSDFRMPGISGACSPATGPPEVPASRVHHGHG